MLGLWMARGVVTKGKAELWIIVTFATSDLMGKLELSEEPPRPLQA
jgi:hypothetical protein